MPLATMPYRTTCSLTTGTAASGGDLVVTLTGVVGQRHAIWKIFGSYLVAAATGRLRVAGLNEDGNGTFDIDIIVGGQFSFDFVDSPLMGKLGGTVTITQTDGSTTKKLNIMRAI